MNDSALCKTIWLEGNLDTRQKIFFAALPRGAFALKRNEKQNTKLNLQNKTYWTKLNLTLTKQKYRKHVSVKK